jgi:hypothetical protein
MIEPRGSFGSYVPSFQLLFQPHGQGQVSSLSRIADDTNTSCLRNDVQTGA